MKPKNPPPKHHLVWSEASTAKHIADMWPGDTVATVGGARVFIVGRDGTLSPKEDTNAGTNSG